MSEAKVFPTEVNNELIKNQFMRLLRRGGA